MQHTPSSRSKERAEFFKSLASPSASTSSNNTPPEDQVQQDAIPVQATSVKLPDFWRDHPTLWFSRVEALFRTKGITTEQTRFDYVVAALSPEVAEQVFDHVVDPDADTPFTSIKEALIDRIGKTSAERTRIALEEETLGDRTPLQLLRRLQAMLPAGDFSSEMFRFHFIQKMPRDIRAHLAAASTDDLSALARRADNLLAFNLAQPPAPSAANVSATADPAPLDEIIARLNLLEKKTKPKYPAQQPRSNNLCFYHGRFGDKARKCQPPCSKNGWLGSRQ